MRGYFDQPRSIAGSRLRGRAGETGEPNPGPGPGTAALGELSAWRRRQFSAACCPVQPVKAYAPGINGLNWGLVAACSASLMGGGGARRRAMKKRRPRAPLFLGGLNDRQLRRWVNLTLWNWTVRSWKLSTSCHAGASLGFKLATGAAGVEVLHAFHWFEGVDLRPYFQRSGRSHSSGGGSAPFRFLFIESRRSGWGACQAFAGVCDLRFQAVTTLDVRCYCALSPIPRFLVHLPDRWVNYQARCPVRTSSGVQNPRKPPPARARPNGGEASSWSAQEIRRCH